MWKIFHCLFFIDTATTESYTYGHTLSLHDALPICWDKTPENQAVNDYLAIKILAEAMAKNKSTEVDKVIAFLEGDNKFDVLRERPGYFRPWEDRQSTRLNSSH